MSDRIGFLKDKDDNNIYPKTIAEAVYLSNDHDVERELNNCQKYSDFHAYNSLESIGISGNPTLLQVSQALSSKGGGILILPVYLGNISAFRATGLIPADKDGTLEVSVPQNGGKARAIYSTTNDEFYVASSENSNTSWNAYRKMYSDTTLITRLVINETISLNAHNGTTRDIPAISGYRPLCLGLTYAYGGNQLGFNLDNVYDDGHARVQIHNYSNYNFNSPVRVHVVYLSNVALYG